jgi:AcrR family transcriptional regulator
MGLDGLSLREVASRLGVSHYAPYKHLPSRDHLVAELIRQAFVEFAHALAQGASAFDGHDALAGMGRAYVSYALRRSSNTG